MVNYAFKKNEENMARAYGRFMSISTKQSVEICSALRGKKISRAKQMLENVLLKKEAIPMKRYNKDTAHKKGMTSGKYPINASSRILDILNNVEANAQEKGLSSNDLVIIHITANKASRPWRYGRQRRRKAKRTHIEIVVEEIKKKEKEKTENKK